MKKEDIKKVVLAYSGGLDTSIIIPWLKENYNNCEVVAVSGDVGQGTELDGLEEKAKATGASKLYVLDLKKDFVENYIFPTLKFGAKYEDYLLGTSFARPCIAKALADIAIKEGADAICHGCTGKGNDQVRFELTLKALCPDMAIIAPWREWDIESRDEEIDYAEAHHIPLKINRETNYSKDKNLWHLSHEGLDLENPANEPQYNKPGFLELGVSPEQAPDTPTYITLHFEKGIPTAVDGKEMGAVELVEYLNKLGGANGIGIIDIRAMYGIGAVAQSKSIDLVIHMEKWVEGKEYDRLGLNDEYITILGVKVPSQTMPVRPGRNLAIIIEVAARNLSMKKLGFSAARELDRRMNEMIMKRSNPDAQNQG